ncbi:Protein of unknown function [Lactobacillus delbrueckii subsp. bulgaricus]|nr:Protein of unknown function [Lactobacillus delbrueckii subsp. bulgaricus]
MKVRKMATVALLGMSACTLAACGIAIPKHPMARQA